MWRASERRAESARCSERASISFRPPAREKGAQVCRRAIGEIGDRGRRAEALGEEGEELPRVAAVSLDGARDMPLAGEPAEPGDDRCGEIGRGGQGGGSASWLARGMGQTIRRNL